MIRLFFIADNPLQIGVIGIAFYGRGELPVFGFCLLELDYTLDCPHPKIVIRQDVTKKIERKKKKRKWLCVRPSSFLVSQFYVIQLQFLVGSIFQFLGSDIYYLIYLLFVWKNKLITVGWVLTVIEHVSAHHETDCIRHQSLNFSPWILVFPFHFPSILIG